MASIRALTVAASLLFAGVAFAQSAAPAAKPAPAAMATAPAAAPAATTAKMTAAAPAAAPAAGGGAGKVWLNTKSNVYHCEGSKHYGKTKEGTYLTEAEAKAKGAHADHGKACSK